ncbi:MAG: hypothetical protein HKP48_07485 [Winogradskyella sp.]|uniref:hypothetical protein n=1 Tax=Winogradskyella sp. TaxID=1883156 RepID=UPI001855A4E7|nr:hypothetical protein [Winogradskyella sp.]MBT8244636.1 hypothetical protein [Winogradskyella sp.]NNK23124.1 hypothetical protein [Winogradskyella sp.]
MPLGESMLSTLKSNKNILKDKSKHFRKTRGGYSKKPKTGYDFPKASPELLLEIKEKIQKQNKKTRTLSLLIAGVLVVVIVLYILI